MLQDPYPEDELSPEHVRWIIEHYKIDRALGLVSDEEHAEMKAAVRALKEALC
jgi:hypothetical protein